MKLMLMALAFLAMLNLSSASAAPPEVEDFCWAQAAQMRFNWRGELEAFMANCIADHTPTPPKRRAYKKRR